MVDSHHAVLVMYTTERKTHLSIVASLGMDVNNPFWLIGMASRAEATIRAAL